MPTGPSTRPRATSPPTSAPTASWRSGSPTSTPTATASGTRCTGRRARRCCSPPRHALAPDAASAESFDLPAGLLAAGPGLARDGAGRLRDRGAAGGRVGGRRGGRAGRPLPAADPRHRRADLRAAGGVLAHARVPALRRGGTAGAGVDLRGRRGGAGRGGAHPRRPAAGPVRARPARRAVDLAGRRRAPRPRGRRRHPRRRRAGDRPLERLRVRAHGGVRAGHPRVVVGAVRRHLPAGQRAPRSG